MEPKKPEVTHASNPKTSNQLSWKTGFLATHKEAPVTSDSMTTPLAKSKKELLSMSLLTSAQTYQIWPLAQRFDL